MDYQKKIHFIGICGAGMSAVAKLYKDLGWRVSGSDDNFYPPASTYIKKIGIKFHKGYRPSNIPPRTDLIVIGKHAGLTPESNSETRTAFDSKRTIKSFPEVLGQITQKRENIVIAGSYGKSTCTALIAWILKKAGQKPGYFIGAIPRTPKESSALGKGKYFVIEGDEYPSSNWDARSKFLHYHPAHLLITSLSHDHLNVFKTAADYRRSFSKLIDILPKNGTITACANGDGNKAALSNRGNVNWYGFDKKSEWRAENIKFGKITSFDLFRGSNKIISLKTKLLGRHNVENILGAAVLLLNLKAVSSKQLGKAVFSFKPLARRLDKKTSRTSVPLYEGFGSSREKAKAAIEAVKLHFPKKKLLVVFEPHTFSWRSRSALKWYDDVFDGSEKVFIYKPPEINPARNQLNLKEIIRRVENAGIGVVGFDEISGGLSLIKKQVGRDNMILILTSGGFDGFLESLIPWLERKFPIQ